MAPTATLPSRDKLEKATADFLALIAEANGKDGGPSAEDRQRLKKAEDEVNGLISLVKADQAAAHAKTLVGDLAKAADAKPEVTDGFVNPNGMTLGEAFVKSPAYGDFLKRHGGLDGRIPDSAKGIQSAPWQWNGSLHMAGKAVATKDLVTGASSTSGGALILNDRYAPITDLVGERELTIRDLVTSGRTTSDTIEYVRVTAKTNNAAAVPEATSAATIDGSTVTTTAGGLKPESAMTLEVVSTPVRTLAHWIPLTKQAVSDAAQVRTMVDNFLRVGLREKEEDQILNGAGGNNLTGILQTAGILTVGSAGTDLDAIVDAIRAIRVTGRRNPTGVVFHPNDWYSTGFALAKDTAGNYLISSPANDPTNARLWGLRIVISEAMTENTALVGDFRFGVLWDREQASIQVSDSHADFFTRNLIAVLAEERLAFGVLDPQAFCTVTAI